MTVDLTTLLAMVAHLAARSYVERQGIPDPQNGSELAGYRI